MRQDRFLVAGAVVLFVVFIGSVIALQPIGQRLPSRDNAGEMTCSEYVEVCDDGCKMRDSGAGCYECCAQAKTGCDASGNYTEHLKKCLIAKSSAL